jgi:hypothetical protein
MRKSSTGGLSPWECVTKPAEIVSMVSRKLTMGWHNPDKLIEATDFTSKQFG